jgi:hypothetical protein
VEPCPGTSRRRTPPWCGCTATSQCRRRRRIGRQPRADHRHRLRSLGYILPIVDRVIRKGSGNGIKVIVISPMNAVTNSQEGEFKKFLALGSRGGQGSVTFARYTGQENNALRNEILQDEPDILPPQGLQFLVLDALHTYRGRQGADVALLLRAEPPRIPGRLPCRLRHGSTRTMGRPRPIER